MVTARVVCPSCGGGRTKERSCLVFDRDGVQLYRCFRASCEHPRGIYSGTVDLTSVQRVVRWPDVGLLPSHRMRWAADKFHLTNDDLSRLRPMWTADHGGRYWYPITDERGAANGGVARSYWTTPKSLTFTDSWGMGAWYACPSSDCIWLVEDQVSACKMAQHHTTVALLGVGLSSQLARHLATLGKPVVVALDGDALGVAVKLSEKLQGAGCTTSVVFLERDIKALTKEEVLCLSIKR